MTSLTSLFLVKKNRDIQWPFDFWDTFSLKVLINITCFWLEKVEYTKSQIYALKTEKTMLYNVSRPEEPIRDKMLNSSYTTRGNVKVTKNPNGLSKNFHFRI